MLLELTELEVSNIINGYICGLVESSMDSCQFEDDAAYCVVKNWKFKSGRVGKLCMTGKTLKEGYHRYGTEQLPDVFSKVEFKELFLKYLILR